MTIPYAAYAAEAGQTDFVVPFPYLNRSHVKVKVNGVTLAIAAWPTASTIRVFNPQTAGAVVEIERETPLDGPLVKFQNGATLTSEDLNTAVGQVLYRQQEMQAYYDRSLNEALVRLSNGTSTSGADVFDEIAAILTERDVIGNLQQRIADIDLNGQEILNQAQAIIDTGAEVAGVSLRTDGLEAVQTDINQSTAALRSDLTTLQGLVDSLAGGDPGSGIATLIADEENARIEGDAALVDTISLIGAVSGDNQSFIADLNSLRASPTETFAQRFTALSASDADNAAAIVTEQNARITAISAEATRIDLLDARIEDAEASVVTERIARVAGDNAVASEVTVLSTRVDTAEADVVSERAARVAGDIAVASDVTALTARVGTAEADILTEQTVRSQGDAALAADVTVLVTRMGDAEAAVINEANARATAIAAEANARQALGVTLRSERDAAFLSEQTARVDGDEAIASDLTALSARVDTAEADILSEATVRSAENSALATDISGLLTRVGTAEATIVTDRQARVAGDNAIATQIDSLQTSVNGNTATVSTLSQSVNGLEARYGVVLDVNGHVTGFAQNNDGVTGSFTVVADQFSIVAPNGGTPVTPFQVSANEVRINGNLIVNGTITSDTIADNAVTLGNSNYTEASKSLPADTWTAAQALVLATTGGKVRVDFCGSFRSDNTQGGAVYYRFKRGTTVIREGALVVTPFPTPFSIKNEQGITTGTGEVPGYVAGTYAVFTVDETPPAGSHTYSIELNANTGAGIAPAVSHRQMLAMEFRK